MSRFNSQTASKFTGSCATPDNVNFLQSDVVTGMTLVGDNAVGKWSEMAGPEDSAVAKVSAPRSIRGAFGTDAVKNAVHASANGGTQRAE